MKRRKWTSQQKLAIVLEGLRGTVPLAQLCTKHQVSQAQFYQWRERLLQEGAALFERGGAGREEERLRQENQRLLNLVGELTVELKKTEEVWP